MFSVPILLQLMVRPLVTYVLEFDDDAESDLDSNDNAEDFEDREIIIMGQEYTISKAQVVGTNDAGLRIELLSGAVKDRLNEGEEQTYQLGGKSYTVLLDFVDEDGSVEEANFIVNGERTGSLEIGETYELNDGTEIGLRDAQYTERADRDLSAEFFLGANKIILEDDNLQTSAGNHDLDVSDEGLEEAQVSIQGVVTANDKVEISSISIVITADDDFFVGEGESLSEQFDDKDNVGAFLGGWDIEYAGLTDARTEEIAITTKDGDKGAVLEFLDADGEKVRLPFAYAAASTLTTGEENGKDFIQDETEAIGVDDVFILTANNESSWAYRFKDGDDEGDYIFESLGNGAEKRVNEISDRDGTNDLRVGGNTFTVQRTSANNAAGDDVTVKIDLDGDGTISTSATTTPIFTDNGARIELSSVPATVKIGTGAKEDYDNVAPANVTFTIEASSGEIDITAPNAGLISDPDKDDVSSNYSSYGAFFVYDAGDSNDAGDVKITYPVVQLLPEVFVTTPGSEIIAGSGNTDNSDGGSAYRISKIAPGATRLASSVASLTGQNTIIVGGPCANPLAAQLLGVGTTAPECTTGFNEGQGRLRAVEHANGNVALLVAGYGPLDTRRAARVLNDYTTYTGLTGDEVVVQGTSFTDIQVSAVAAPVVAPVQ